MDNTYPNIFGNPKSAQGGYTCGVCFQEFVHYNDMSIHERMHLEQMSFAGIQTHFLPQFDNRATVFTSNIQANLQPQTNNHTLGVVTPKELVISQPSEKGNSAVCTTVQSVTRPQQTVNRTSAFDTPVSYTKGESSSITESQVPLTHIELKTPTYTLITSYDRDIQPVKRAERSKSQEESKSSLYDTEAVQEKVTHNNSSNVSVLGRPHDEKSLPLYEVTHSSIEKNIIPTRSDINLVGVSQTDPRSTLYDLTTLERNLQLSQFEAALQKPQVETITLYPENLHVEGYGKRQVLATPTVIQANVDDYNHLPVSRQNDYPETNIQYQVPISSIRQTAMPQYSTERQQPAPIHVIEMPLSADYYKKQTENSTAAPTISQSVNSNITNYVPATLSYSPLNPINSSFFRPEHVQSSSPGYQRFDSHQVIQGQLEKLYPESFSQSQYQSHMTPVSNNGATPVQSPQAVYFSEPNANANITKSVVTNTVSVSSKNTKQSITKVTVSSSTAVSASPVSASGLPAKQFPVIMLPNGTFYPSGLPLPETFDKAEFSCTSKENNEHVAHAASVQQQKTADNMAETAENEEELNKKKEFVDMIKMVQGERKYYKKHRHISASSDSENNESSYEYKVDIVCFICSEEFENEKKLFEHLCKHRKNGELSPSEESDDDDGERKKKKLCKYCGKQFMRLHQLIEHIRKHTEEKAYECRFCNRSYVVKQRCLKHEATHKNEETGIHCEVCEKELEDKAQYLFHVHGHVLDQNKREAEEKQQKFADMIRSVQTDKSEEKEQVDDNENQMLNLLLNFDKETVTRKPSTKEAEKENAQTIICRICQDTVAKKDFIEHFKSHKLYICDECGRGFTRKLNYIYHSDTMHWKEEINSQITRKTFICSVCERKFFKKSKLKLHLETHVSDKPLIKCDICEKPFHHKGDYFFHLNKHDVADMVKIEEKEREKKESLGMKSKIVLKNKTQSSQTEVNRHKSTKKCKASNATFGDNLKASRELRNRDKRKTNYSWQGLVEENLKASLKDANKRKSGYIASIEDDHHCKRIRNQVDQYSESLSGVAPVRKLRVRIPVKYDDGGSDEDRYNDSDCHQKEIIINDEDVVEKVNTADQKLSEPLKCKVCKKQVPKFEFIAHFKNHCLLSCEECERSFIKRNNYVSHFQNIHGKEITQEHLEKELSKLREYRLQKQRERNEQKQMTAKLKVKEATNTIEQIKKSSKLKENKVKEDNKQKQLSPTFKHRSETKLSKEQESCRYRFENETKNPFVCILCKKRFNKKINVINHIKTHFNSKKTVTENCGPYSAFNQMGQCPLKYKDNTQSFKKGTSDSEQKGTENNGAPKIKSYFCGICKRTITRKQNFEAHMKARHSNETQENKQVANNQSVSVSCEPKLKLGIDVRSPPKKRKIFVDDVLEDRSGIPVVSHHGTLVVEGNNGGVSSTNEETKTIKELHDVNKFHTAMQTIKQSGVLQPRLKKHTKGKTELIDKSELDLLIAKSKDLIVGKPGKSYPKFCPVCHQEQKSLRFYTEHMRVHTGDKPFKCDVCQHQFTRERNCKAHMKKLHPNKSAILKYESKDLTNVALATELKENARMGLNLESTKVKDSAVESNVGIQRETCQQAQIFDMNTKSAMLGTANATDISGHNSRFKSLPEQDEPKALDLSMKEIDLHVDSSGSCQGNTNMKFPREAGVSNTSFKKCPICFMKIYSKESFDTHLSSHSELKPFSCKFCDMCFEEKRQLYDHRKTHPVEKLVTNTSSDYSSEDSAAESVTKHGKASGQQYVGKTKRQYHEEENQTDLVCKLCYANFMTKAAFDTHVQLHVEEDTEEKVSDVENSSDLSNRDENPENCMLDDNNEHTSDNLHKNGSENLDNITNHKTATLDSNDQIQVAGNTKTGSPVQGSNQHNSTQDNIENMFDVEQKKMDKPVSENVSNYRNMDNYANIGVNESLAEKNTSNMQPMYCRKKHLGESQNLYLIPSDYAAESPVKVPRILPNLFESSDVESASPKDRLNGIRCFKHCELLETDNGYSIGDSGAGNYEGPVYTEACLHGNIREHNKGGATVESEINVRKADDMYFVSNLPRIQEGSGECMKADLQKDLVPMQMYANYSNKNDMYRNSWNSPVQSHLLISPRNKLRTYASEAVFSDKESECSTYEYWHEKVTDSPQSVLSQTVTKMSAESAVEKWKQKVELVLFSQLELNESRKLDSQNKVENTYAVDRGNNQFNIENVSGAMDKFECRLCGDFITDREEFVKHIDVHMNESPPYCELCDIYFMAIYPKRRLIEHNRKKHPDRFVPSEDL